MGAVYDGRALPPLRYSLARLRLRADLPKGPLLLAGAILVGGVLLRLPVFSYHGARTQVAFNKYIFQYPGSYSDIASLYFRDHLWLHRAPYFDYRFEYPVVAGGFVWLVSFIHSSVAAYMLASAAILGGLALLTVWLVSRYEGSRVWILAAAPVLGLDLILNWDVLGIAFTVAALLMYQRNRDAWGGGLLALGVWAKLFPLLLLPIVVIARAREREWRRMFAGLASFALVSVVVNLPVAVTTAAHGGRLIVRSKWAYFYTFNAHRRDVGGLWWFFGWLHPKAPEINKVTAVLLALGLGAVLIAMLIGSRRVPAGKLIAPAFLAMIAWFLFTNKIYSPQFGLWVVVMLAVAGAPLVLAVPFVIIDTAYYFVSFLGFKFSGHWYFPSVIRPTAGVREFALLTVVLWSVIRIARAGRPPALAADSGLGGLGRSLATAPSSR